MPTVRLNDTWTLEMVIFETGVGGTWYDFVVVNGKHVKVKMIANDDDDGWTWVPDGMIVSEDGKVYLDN